MIDNRIRIGLIAGLVAVTTSTIASLALRAAGVFPDGLDLKHLAEWAIDPVTNATTGTIAGVAIHVVLGAVTGVIYLLLVRRSSPVTGVLFMLPVWLFMNLILFPLTNRGLLGLDQGVALALGTLFLNVLFGSVLGAVAQRLVAPAGAGADL